MRILYFSDGYTPHDHRYLRAMCSQGIEVFYLRVTAGHRTEDRSLPEGVRAVGDLDGSPSIWQSALRVRSLLSSIQPDLVHAGPIYRPAFLVAINLYRPLVAMSWGSDLLIDCSRGVRRLLARFTLARSRFLICDSDIVKETARRLGAKGDRIVQFPYGVDLDLFDHSNQKTTPPVPLWSNYKILISTRNLEPLYDVDVLIRAFIQVAEDQHDLRLLVLGDGTQREVLESVVREAGMTDRAIFLGRIPNNEVPVYLQMADLFVTTSTSDGSSISLLEAMASGLPVVASDIQANREWVIGGRNGWLFPSGDSSLLAEVIREAVSDPDRLNRYGSASRAVAEASADWRNGSRLMLNTYRLAVE